MSLWHQHSPVGLRLAVPLADTSFHPKDGVQARVTRKSIGAGGQYLLDLAVGSLLIKARVSHSIGRDAKDSVWTNIASENITFFDKAGKAL